MLRASFGEEGKLDELEMMFDGIAVHQQLQRAMGGKQDRVRFIYVGERHGKDSLQEVEGGGGRRAGGGVTPGERRAVPPTR